MACFCWFSPFFAKQTAQTHKITSYGDGMRQFLRPKFRSHGTNLGSLGLKSQKATGKTFSKYLCPIIWDLYESPILLEFHGPIKKLGTFRSQCVAASHPPSWIWKHLKQKQRSRYPVQMFRFPLLLTCSALRVNFACISCTLKRIEFLAFENCWQQDRISMWKLSPNISALQEVIKTMSRHGGACDTLEHSKFDLIQFFSIDRVANLCVECRALIHDALISKLINADKDAMKCYCLDHFTSQNVYIENCKTVTIDQTLLGTKKCNLSSSKTWVNWTLRLPFAQSLRPSIHH